MKKTFLLFVSFVFCLALQAETTPATSYAGGSGTEADPYQIETLAQLRLLSETSSDWSKYFVLTANINAADTKTWNSGKGFNPIGDGSTNFIGVFDGNGHTIDGLFIDKSSNYNGLFGTTYDAFISNVLLTNCDINCFNFSGGLIGKAVQTSIKKCSVTGSVNGENANPIGGLVGQLVSSTISQCYTNCLLTGAENTGGLVGFTKNSSIKNCFVDSHVLPGSDYHGGIAGKMENDSVIFCYVNGVVEALSSDNYIGAISGHNSDGTILNNYYNLTNSPMLRATGYSSNETLVTALNTNDFTDKSNFDSLDFTNIWGLVAIADYDTVKKPYLKWQYDYIVAFELGEGAVSFDKPDIFGVLEGGSVPAIEAYGANGYLFKNWQDADGTIISTDNPFTLTNVSSNTTIYAVFDLKTSTIEPVSSEGINISPNPTTGLVSIPLESGIANLTVFSITGKQVYSNPAFEGGSVNLTDLQQGLYVVKLYSEGKLSIVKLIKK